MPRETWTAPAALPLFSTSGASRTSTTSVLPLAIISRASAGVIRGTAALAASIICLTLVAMASSSPLVFMTVGCGSAPEPRDRAKISRLSRHNRGDGESAAWERRLDRHRNKERSDAALGMVKPSRRQHGARSPSHRRIGVAAAERAQSIGGAGDVEVEGEMLVDGE